MNRRALLLHLQKHECFFLREGKRHSVFFNPREKKTSTVPRHSELNDILTNKICKDLGIPRVRK